MKNFIILVFVGLSLASCYTNYAPHYKGYALVVSN